MLTAARTATKATVSSSARRYAATLALAGVGLLASIASQADFLSPIPTYGTDGTAVFTVSGGFTLRDDEPGGIVAAAVTDSEGQLYVLYRAVPPPPLVAESRLYLVRLGSTGTLDSSYGPVDFGASASFDDNVALALDQARDRFYLVTLPPAETADAITVSARNFQGDLDTAFNGGADLVITPPDSRLVDNRYSLAATVNPTTGRLLLAGAFLGGTTPDDALGDLQAVTYAVTSEGALDTTFNSSGLRIESPALSSNIDSTLAFGVATSSTTSRVLTFGSGRVTPSNFVGTVFSNDVAGAADTTFGTDGLGQVNITADTAPSEGQANLTQLLFGRVLPSGVTQLIGINGVLQLSNRTYVSGTTSVAGIQLTPAGVPDTRFKGTGIFTTPYVIGRAPPTVLFANGSFASVFKSSATEISVLAVEGFSVFAEDGTTGGSTTGSGTSGGTTGGTTSGGTTTGGTTTGGTTTGGTTTGGTTTGGTTTGSTTGGTTTGGTTTGGATSGGTTTGSAAGGGGGSFGTFGIAGLLIGALLRRRRGAVRAAR